MSVIIIPCGKKKLEIRSQAKDLYIGSLFKAHLAWALSVANPCSIFILSAKHGLLRLDQEVDPYDTYMGEEGSVDTYQIKCQANDFGISDSHIYFTGGAAYRSVIGPAFKNICFPMPKVGMGYIMQILKRSRGRLPIWKPEPR